MWSLPPFVQNTFPSVLDGGLLLAGACTIAVVSRPYYQSLDLAIAPLGRVTRATRKQAACLINELPASNPVAAPAELSPLCQCPFPGRSARQECPGTTSACCPLDQDFLSRAGRQDRGACRK